MIEPLNHPIISDKRVKNDYYNYILSNETVRKKLTSCQFPDLLIQFCKNQCIEHLRSSFKKLEFWLKLTFLEPQDDETVRKVFGHPQKCLN